MTSTLSIYPGPYVEYLVLPGEERREVGCNSDTPADADWVPVTELPGHDPDEVWDLTAPDFKRTTRVPVSLPSFAVPCPECKGFPDGGAFKCKRCEPFEGRGTIDALGWVEEQWRFKWPDSSEWSTTKPAVLLPDNHDARWAITSVSDVLGVLPVTDENTTVPPGVTEYLYVDTEGVSRVVLGDGWLDVTVEPWASDLQPGDAVLHLGPPRVLEEPIVEMVCSGCGGYGGSWQPERLDDDWEWEAGTGYFHHLGCRVKGTVPLDPPSGLSTVEVEL